MHPRRSEQIASYTGVSANGEPQEFRGVGNRPGYKVVDLGELPDPMFAVGQRFDIVGNKTPRPRRVVRVIHVERGGKAEWAYRACDDRWPKSLSSPDYSVVTETRMRRASIVTLLDG